MIYLFVYKNPKKKLTIVHQYKKKNNKKQTIRLVVLEKVAVVPPY